LVPEEMEKIKTQFGEINFAAGKFDLARQIFEPLALNDQFIDFFTLAAYQYLE
jgi:malate synthase